MIQEAVTAKQYKAHPKHLFWEDSAGTFFKIEPIGKTLNLFHWIEKGVERGCLVIGINIFSDWLKITESEYNYQKK
jgi:hypothetical protein